MLIIDDLALADGLMEALREQASSMERCVKNQKSRGKQRVMVSATIEKDFSNSKIDSPLIAVFFCIDLKYYYCTTIF